MTLFRILADMQVFHWLASLGFIRMDRARLIELDRHNRC